MSSLSSARASSYILRLHLTAPNTCTDLTRTLTTPCSHYSFFKLEMPMPTGAFVAVYTQREKKSVFIMKRPQRAILVQHTCRPICIYPGSYHHKYKRLQDNKYNDRNCLVRKCYASWCTLYKLFTNYIHSLKLVTREKEPPPGT